MLQNSVSTSSVASLPPRDNPGSPTEEMSVVSFLGLLGLMAKHPVARERPVSVSHPKKKIPSEPTFRLSDIVAARKLTLTRPIPCTLCDKTFRTHQKLNRHLPVHTGKKLYSCPECPKLFTSDIDLKRHHKYFHQVNTYCCPYCEKNFFNLSRCKEHLLTHTQADPYSCMYCPAVFVRFTDLSTHLQLRHAQESPEAIHYTEKTAIKCVPCPHCHEEFSSSYLMKVHLRTHTEEESHKRSCCDQSCHQTSSLKVHEMSHSAEKNHTSIHTLRMHFLNPNQKTIYVCPNCQAEFADYSQFVAHNIFHKNSTLDCPEEQTISEADVEELLTSPSEESFPARQLRSQQLRHDSKQHQDHSDIQLYYCPECSAPYSQLRTLKRHLKEYHQKEPKDIEIELK